MRQIIAWEEGSKVVEECIDKAKMVLDGYQPGALFKPEDYIKYYEYPCTSRLVYLLHKCKIPCTVLPILAAGAAQKLTLQFLILQLITTVC